MSALLKKQSTGAHRLDFAVTLTVISILATLLLNSLNRAQVSIEQMTRDAELNNIRLAIAESWVHKQVSHQSINIKALVNTNPMRFINEQPKNYIGEISAKPHGLYTVWYFDINRKQLVYVHSDATEVRYALINTASKSSSSKLSAGGLDLAQVTN